MSLRPTKIVPNSVTGQHEIVPVDDAEWADIQQRQANAASARQAEADARAQRQAERDTERAERQSQRIDAADVNAVVDLEGLKVIVRKQTRLINQLLKRVAELESRFPDAPLG